MRPGHWLGLVLGGRKDIRPVKNPGPLIPSGFVHEQMEEEEENPRGPS